jgi:anti-sigma regulatory factor (Ser/Thr protein kinase)
MITISMPSVKGNWTQMSFPSTLYLYPVLDLLLHNIPPEFEPEIRLGLQEALVNAAKHGNQLDPKKSVCVHFYRTKEGYFWVISDEGQGFNHRYQCAACNHPEIPPEEAENGRGMCLLAQIFDRVHWNPKGTELKLCKQIKKRQFPKPVLS